MKHLIILVMISLPLWGCSASVGTTPATSTTTYTTTPVSSTTYSTTMPATETTVVKHYN